VTILLVVVIARGALRDRRAARDGRRLVELQAALVTADEPSGDGYRIEQAVAALPLRAQASLLAGLLPNLAGQQRAALLLAVAGTDLPTRAEGWCRSRFWRRRRQGVRLLALLDTGSGAAAQLLHDPHQRVRNQAVSWAARHPTADVIGALLEMVGRPRQAAPFLVKDALVRIGDPVVDPLIRFLTVERGARLRVGLEIATALADPRVLPAALAASADSSPDNRALAATLAGRMGGEDAVRRLRELLGDPDPAVRAAAAGGLGTCAHWPSAAQVASLLGDSAWLVRSEAAVALGAMGAPGILLLRRSLTDEDPFARDAAHRVLDLLHAGSQRSAG
jgi:HEAT repeat protein